METARIAPIRLDREDEKKMLPCRFFSNGYCHKGNRCRFYHPLNTNLGSIIRVPPLPSGFGPGAHANAGSSPNGAHDAGQRVVRPAPPPPLSPQQRLREQRLSSTTAMTPPSAQQQRIAQGLPPQQYVQQLQPSPRMMADYSALQRPPAPLVHHGYASAEYDFAQPPMAQHHHMTQPVPQYHHAPPAPQVYEPEYVMPHQHTLFAHIDWSEFLAPGQQPPPPTLVPDEHRQSSPRGGPDSKNSGDSSDEAPSTSVSNEDMPPEGRNRKLSAREELQMKVKQIADDIAQEQVPPIQSLDSFLQNFGYNGMLPKLPKLKKLGREAKKIQENKIKASGDATEYKPPKAPEEIQTAAGLPTTSTSDDRFSVRNMADALIEIYVASEREKREKQLKSKDSLTSQKLM